MRTSYRTIALWVVLIVLMIAFYNFFSVPEHGPTSAAEVPERTWYWLPTFIAVVAVGVAFRYFRTRKWLRLNAEGMALLNRGHYLEALEKFELARARAKKNAGLHFNIGVVKLWLWRATEAEREFLTARSLKLAESVDALAGPKLALAAALQGKMAEARAHRALAKLKPEVEREPTAALAEAVILLREGDVAGALRVIDAPELRALNGAERGLADALRAWCIERLSGERRTVDPIALYGETGPDTVKALWPELAEFVEANVAGQTA